MLPVLKGWGDSWRRYWNRIDVWETFHFLYPFLFIFSILLTLLLLFIWLWRIGSLLWPSWCNWLLLALDIALIRLTVYARKP